MTRQAETSPINEEVLKGKVGGVKEIVAGVVELVTLPDLEEKMSVRLIGLKESWIEMAASRKNFGIHELGNGGRKAISRGLVLSKF